ncbi:MAG: class I SAM-dependent methyltransferase [Phycisphaerae bacterium]|nr:class I SAM-dependent methyltransferase [Phycisphaerae bacterium]
MRSLFPFGSMAARYDQWYATPDGQAHDRVQKSDVRLFLGRAAGSQRLLDVGCGTGHWCLFFAEMGYQVTGIDVATEMIQAARQHVPGGSFEVADAADLPFEDKTFDVVAAMAMLEFVPDPRAALREMARCAKPGGRLLIGTLNRHAPLNQERLATGRQPYASARLFSPEPLRVMLAPLGRIRMVASTLDQQASAAPSDEATTASVGTLDGALLVAEVRL